MSTPQLNLETVGNLVRHWVHFDNAIADMNKKIKEMRDTKNAYEQQILQILKASSIKQPVIQIANGRILVAEDKTSQPLSYTMLETMLNNYYAAKPGSRPETKEILKYIRDNRTSQVSPCLKRIMTQKSRNDTKV
jgi:hypothetical protein